MLFWFNLDFECFSTDSSKIKKEVLGFVWMKNNPPNLVGVDYLHPQIHVPYFYTMTYYVIARDM